MRPKGLSLTVRRNPRYRGEGGLHVVIGQVLRERLGYVDTLLFNLDGTLLGNDKSSFHII